jgi:catechol 2,3-dioxygenase-like lactoylglutathione lyase family enzyme
MIGYVTVGTNDLPRALSFYEKLFEPLGAYRIMENAQGVAWGFGPTAAAFGVLIPHDKNPATVGNGSMCALSMSSKAKVDSMHRHALSLGAKDEGQPGQRTDTFYAAYFRDLDGNKLGLFYMT